MRIEKLVVDAVVIWGWQEDYNYHPVDPYPIGYGNPWVFVPVNDVPGGIFWRRVSSQDQWK